MPRRQRVNPTEEAKRYCSLQTDKHGTEVKFIDDTIGHGVFATTPFTKGEFILEYPGEKISIQEGDRREEDYDDDRGSFLFFFGNKFCIDATFAKRNGRMVNDEAPKKAACNSIIKAIVVNGEHRLCIFAKRDIHEGEEVRYDYGVQDLPWRVKESDEEKHAKVEDGLQLDNQLKQLEPAEDDYRNNCNQEKGLVPTEEAMESRNSKKHEISSKTKPESDSGSGLEANDLHLDSPDHPDPLTPIVLEEMITSIRSREKDHNQQIPAEEATESFRSQEEDNGTSGKLKPVTDSGIIREGNNLHPDSPDHLDQLAVPVLEDMINRIHSREKGHDPTGEAMKSCRNREKPEISSKTKPDSASVSGLEVDSLHLHSPSWPNEPSDSSDASDDPDYKYSGTDSEESDESDDNISASEADTGCETEEVFNFNASEAPDSTTGYVRPKRPCPFCGIFQSKLSRHIQLKHGNVTEVKDATQAPKGDRLKKFSDFKKKGILNENKKQAKEDQPVYQQERVNRTAGKLIMCGTCNGFYHSRFLSRHKKGCVESSEPSVNVPLSLLDSLDSQSADGFVTSILAKMRDDDIANICRQDQAIKLVGMRLWMKHKRKADKKTEVRKSVMTGMRRLASIYKSFCHLHAEEHKLGPIQPMVKDQQSAADMFVRSNFKRLETAIIACTTREAAGGVDELKHGLKSGIYYLFKKSAKILKGSYLIDDEDVLADRVDKFIEIFEMNNDILFGDAAYATYKARNENLRKPEALPLEEDIEKVRKYVVSRMEAVTSDCYSVFDSHAFVELRDLAVCRLTLFNARRGGEPSRLQMKEWADAEAGVWINDKAVQRLDNPLDRYLADQLKVAYQTGKGNKHLVPVLIPKDVVAALKMLADAEIRKVAGIDSQNPYLFPSTGCSQFHVSGWHAVNRVCQKLELTRGDLLTATKNRHRVSTIYAAMEVPEGERQYFYSHMGHSKEMNQNVYQAPLALMEVIRVGKSLSKMDGVEDNARMMPDTSSPSTSPCNSSAVEDDAGGMPVTRSSPDTAAYSSSSSAGVEDKARMMPDTSSASTLPCTSSAGVSISDDEDIPLDRVMKALAADNGATSTENPLKRGCSSSMGCQSTKAKQVKKPARKYSQWTEEETKLVLRYFSKFIKGSGTTLPNQQDIRDFKEAHPSMTQDFQTIKSKVFNERSKNRKLEKQRLDELNM